MNIYSAYIDNFLNAKDAVRIAKEARPAFMKFLEVGSSPPRCWPRSRTTCKTSGEVGSGVNGSKLVFYDQTGIFPPATFLVLLQRGQVGMNRSHKIIES